MADERLSSFAKPEARAELKEITEEVRSLTKDIAKLSDQARAVDLNLKGSNTLKDVVTQSEALVDANGKLISSYGDVSKSLANYAVLKAQLNGSTDTYITGATKLVRLNAEEAKTQQQVNKALQEGEKARLASIRADQAADKQARTSAKSQQDLTNEYGLLSKAYNEAALKAKNYSLTLGANSPITKQATADALAMGQKLKELDASVGQNQRNVGNYSSVLTGYANTLRGLRGPTKLLGEAIGVGAQAADQLRLVIEHSLQGIAAYFRGKEAKAAAETKDTAATVANTVAAEENAAAQTTENVATEVSNSVLKTNVTIKDANVLASKALNTQSKTYTFSLATTTAATEANTIATEASAVAETELAVATAGASTAMKVFRTALLLTGIGLAIALIAGLVLAIRDNIKAAKDAKLAQEDLSKALESTEYGDAIKNVQSLTQNIKLAKEGLVDKNVVLKQYNETVGKTTGVLSSFNDIEQTLVKNTPAYIQMMLYKAAANIALEEAAKKAVDAEKIRLKSLEDFKNNITDNRISSGGAGGFGTGAFNPNDYDSETQRIEKAEKKRQDAKIKIETDAQQKQLDIATKFNQQVTEIAKKNGFSIFGDAPPPAGSVAALEKRRDDLKALINLQKVGSQEQIASTKELIEVEKQLKAIEGHPGTNHNQIPNDFNSEVIAAQKKAIEEQSKNRAAGLKDDEAAFKAVADDEAKSLSDRLLAYSQYIQSKKALVREEKDSQIAEAKNTITQLNAEVAKDDSLIAGGKLTPAQKTSLQNKNKAIGEQIKALNDTIARLSTERITEQSTIESEGQKGIAAIVKNSSENIVKIKQAEINQIKADNEAAKNSELTELRKRLDNEQITYKEFKAQEQAINERYALQEEQSIKNKLTQDLKELKDSGLDTTQLQKDLNAALKALYDADTKAFDDAQQTKAEAIKELHDKEKEFAREALTAVKALFDANYQNQISQYDDLINKVKERADADISAAEAQGLSAKDLAAKKAAIQAQAASEEKRLSDEQRSIKKKQAEIDTAVSVAQILATALQTEFELEAKASAATAQAALLASNPVTASYAPVAAAAAAAIHVEEGIVAGIAALQVAAVIANAPKFFVGTKSSPEGLAWIGEKGRELRINPDGSKELTPGVATLDFLEAGTQIIPNHELIAMTQMYGLGLPLRVPQSDSIDMSGLERSLNQQTERLVDVISNKKEVHMSWTVHGWNFSIKEAQARQAYIKKNIHW